MCSLSLMLAFSQSIHSSQSLNFVVVNLVFSVGYFKDLNIIGKTKKWKLIDFEVTNPIGIRNFRLIYYEREDISSTKIGDGSDIMKEKKSYESNVVESVNSNISEENNCVGGQFRIEAKLAKKNKYKNDHSNGKMA
ncbi:hypothetical protein Syun_027723 [Stephania yunnanensis]|uniref:Uncharacterized protein n=1 Tax=Stephania yunnanensis TaxID=152371 RepID=A0AAP0EJF6_9MAGN